MGKQQNSRYRKRKQDRNCGFWELELGYDIPFAWIWMEFTSTYARFACLYSLQVYIGTCYVHFKWDGLGTILKWGTGLVIDWIE